MWAYCAVRDANFLPNGDFAGSREEVIERLQGDYALGGWNVVIGEPELEQYGFHNFSGRTLLELLPKRKDGQLQIRRWSALRPSKPSIDQKTIILIGAATLILLAAAGWYTRQLYQKREQERERAMELVRQQMIAAAANAPAQFPWRDQPLPADLARTCVAKLTPVTPGGWLLDQFQCDATHVNYTWARNGSNIGYLRERVPTAQVALSGDTATDSQPIKIATTGKETLLASDQIIRTLLARCQSLGVTLKLTAPPPPPTPLTPPPGSPAAPIPPPPPWKKWNLSADLATLTPVAAAELLSQPGVRLERILWRAGLWSIEGMVYAK